MSYRRAFLALSLSLLAALGLSLSPAHAQEEPDSAAPPAAESPEAGEAADEPPADEPAAEEGAPEAEPPADAPSTSEEQPAPDAPPNDAPAGDAPAADAPAGDAPSADAAPGEAAAKYQTLLKEWKDALANLRKIDVDYTLAEESDLAGLAEQWNEELARTRKLIGPLRNAAVAAYRENPAGQDRELEQFLVKLLEDDARRDNLEQGYEIGKLLIDNGVRTDTTLAATGISAYGVNEYDDAEKYLQEALRMAPAEPQGEDMESLTGRASELLASIPNQRKLWEEEQAFRAKEAEADDLPRVRLETSEGPIVVELFENEAPNTVANFVSLVEKGFYDGLKFHRVLPHFVAQGGDPRGDGSGGPGYAIADEWPNDPNRNHFRGVLSMAHAGRDTGGSQFFLTMLPTPHLNDLHTVFGRVIEGFDVLSELQRVDPQNPTAGKEPDVIVKATVERKRDHEYEPETLPER
ncbi:MAG TPA: peptidylprolyl isomerase [Pirellulaceae bacterium]|jgi:cyclophilin family peptidyl-prolyl cis-trans isomerase|nr:peptidylprolyl isomerase [Pirellulaceae bacterium]